MMSEGHHLQVELIYFKVLFCFSLKSKMHLNYLRSKFTIYIDKWSYPTALCTPEIEFHLK